MFLPAWALAMTLAPRTLEVPRVAATIPPLAAVARELAGPDARVNALLVIPAAAAKLAARSLRQMFFLTPAVGLASVVLGLAASYRLDLPSGPSVAVVAGLFFLGAWAGGAPRRATGGRGARPR